MGQVALSQRDYTNLIVERYGTGRDLERFSDKFPREKTPLNGVSWIQIQTCLTSLLEHSSLYGKGRKMGSETDDLPDWQSKARGHHLDQVFCFTVCHPKRGGDKVRSAESGTQDKRIQSSFRD